MKTPDKRNSLPPELDALLHDQSDADVAGLQEIWALSDSPPVASPAEEAALQRVWARLEQHIDADKPSMRTVRSDRPAIARTRLMRRWVALAATVMVAAIIGIGYLFTPVTITAPLGETAMVYLEDGSSVELNSGSTLLRPRFWGSTREVTLDGEAYFDIAKEARPFMVTTFNAEVRVLGTRFNVRAWRKDVASNTTVALASGSVALTGLHTDDTSVTLVPGQTGVVAAKTLEVNEVDTVRVGHALAWRSGDFFFSDEWLGSILDDVERRFNTQVTVKPGALRGRRMKLSIEKPVSAEAILKDICEPLGLRYRETSVGFELFDPAE